MKGKTDSDLIAELQAVVTVLARMLKQDAESVKRIPLLQRQDRVRVIDKLITIIE